MSSAPWSLHLLGEVLSAFSLDRPYPLRDVVSRVAEGIDAEITAILSQGSFNVCTGLTAEQRPDLQALAESRGKTLEVGRSLFHLFWAPVGPGDLLVVGRAEPYNLEERALLLGMSRCVHLSCQVLAAVRATQAAEEAIQLEKAALLAEKMAKEEAIRHATVDHLTGLANRRLILHHLGELLRSQAAIKGRIAVMFIDLDKFKQINDTHGHKTGDLVLKATADQLRAVARDTDLVGRLAGDEFLMIAVLREATDAEGMARRILQRMQESTSIEAINIAAAASIGIALAECDDSTDTLLENADLAMYAAKQMGRGRYAVYDKSMRNSQSAPSHQATDR